MTTVFLKILKKVFSRDAPMHNASTNSNNEWKLTCCGLPIDFSRATHIAEQDQEIFYETFCRRCGREFDIYVFPSIG